MELVKNTKIDFMGLKKYAFSFSAMLVILGIVGTVQIYRGKANLGIDLAGGTEIQVKFQKPFAMDRIRALLAKAGHGDATLQQVSGENILFLKLRALGKQDEKMVADPVVTLLRQSLPDNPFVVESVSEIGPAIGHKLRKDAELAMLVSALAIILYLAWRFEFKFGVAAAIATFHDIFSIVGIFWVLGIEMDLLFITALLTIGGYSLTDTVVVFDRIRENIRLRKKVTFSETINLSVNEVLSRTIVTSMTVFIAVVTLLVFGGLVLHNFALALAMGIVVGTYSSVFVASPVVAIWRGEKMTEVKR
ncbi:MAG: protein translocase subunit SecF [Deltaproteobacteria bacterium 37-65-8]|nr:protein translocase subunit SecF [Deltaproteobacteria bacterium]OYV99266.1 MAG: protein translocase subunit SecF [Deltaproteobacteria bacterium 37-65-8]HQT96701.1 protein translocase subunit SecF [Thermodesulfobacteriota bacterium]